MHMRDRPNSRAPSKSALRELRTFDTATLYEAAGRAGAMASDIRPIQSGYQVVGPALTVACPAGDNLMLHAALAGARPGEVLVVQCHDDSFGVWGEVLTTSALALGVAGLIIDGGVRDIPAIRESGFPVFCRAISIRGAAKKRSGLVRMPISCGKILVWPGDMIVADDSGVIAIPVSELESTLANARARQAKEDDMMKALRKKQTTLELLNLKPALTDCTDECALRGMQGVGHK
jgi:4-hydroxy-4-methyl-2-oxoglutarate aldolase